jgi:hypothetical protein
VRARQAIAQCVPAGAMRDGAVAVSPSSAAAAGGAFGSGGHHRNVRSYDREKAPYSFERYPVWDPYATPHETPFIFRHWNELKITDICAFHSLVPCTVFGN